MTQYIVNYTVDSRKGAGGTGWSMGNVQKGFIFTPVASQVNGWLPIALNKWVPVVACSVYGVTPPPPPPEEPPLPEIERCFFQKSIDGGITWITTKTLMVI